MRRKRPMRTLAVGFAALAMVLGLTSTTAQAREAVGAPDDKVTAQAPNFKAPFPCGQKWTYSHHSAEVRRALDFVRSDGGGTAGSPVTASAAGTATLHWEAGGAGNYVVINHGGGWKTYYFHLQGFSVHSGTHVAQGQQIGTTGSTGASSGPHQHYEQLLNGVGQNIRINGVALPYPPVYGQRHLTSDNCGGGGDTNFHTWGNGINVRGDAYLNAPVVNTLGGPTPVFVECQKEGDTVHAEGYINHWWSKLRDQGGFISNIYISDPASKLPGVPIC